MKKLVFLFCLLLSFLSFGQDNTLINDLAPLKNSKSQIKYILNLNIDSIPEDGFSKLLKIKLNSELNNLGDLFAFYADGKDLELSKKEQFVLENNLGKGCFVGGHICHRFEYVNGLLKFWWMDVKALVLTSIHQILGEKKAP